MTRRDIKFVFYLLLLLSINTFSQPTNKILFKGNKLFNSETLQSLLDSVIQRAKNNSIKAAIEKLYSYYGYYHTDVIIKKYENDKTQIEIDEGNPTFINKIFVDARDWDSTFITDVINELQGKIFSVLQFEEYVDRLLDYYERQGYPFAKIEIASIYFFENQNKHFADIYLNIDKGILAKIEKIEIEGNNKTKKYVILRNAGISAGEIFTRDKINKIPERLMRLKYFDTVEKPEYFINNKNEGVLRIKVKEKQTNQFDGIIGYVPAGASGKGYVTGLVNVGLGNIFGTGRNLSFRWQNENRNSQELEVNYLEPWLLGFPLNLSSGLFQRIQDSTYVQRNLSAELIFIASEDVTGSISVAHRSTIPTERKMKSFTVYNSTSLITGVNLSIDTRKNVYSPLSGILFNNTYKLNSKKINGPAEYLPEKRNYSLQQFEVDFSYYLEIFRLQVLAFAFHAREIRGDNIEVSDMYLLGGSNTLRGYIENQFAGKRILWSNIEYRYILTQKTYAFLFFDTGYFKRDDISDYKFGYGMGINFETAFGIMSVSFALGKGDSYREGKIHFGIINEF
ncbi:BamA/OMP85 family outer membrane protein [Melioribacter sp. OK-6-Me]|uniref:BamA/OMP85 family outer membrane protein n=1 Tax=unclassified Melioribacter TaxID=2627329 RepID=UPI003ED86CF6